MVVQSGPVAGQTMIAQDLANLFDASVPPGAFFSRAARMKGERTPSVTLLECARRKNLIATKSDGAGGTGEFLLTFLR